MDGKSKKKQLNLYYLLGVSKDADQATIKSAYKKLALKWHPDKNSNSEESTEMFKSISEAYAVLSNPQRRKRYDMYGETSPDEGGMDGFDGFADMFGGSDDWLFGGADDDAFEDFIKILEGDNTTSFQSMFRNLGRDYRTGPKGGRARAAKGAKKGGGKAFQKDMENMESMMMTMMMGEMMGEMGGAFDPDEDPIFAGLGGGKKTKVGAKGKDSSEGDWETVE